MTRRTLRISLAVFSIAWLFTTAGCSSDEGDVCAKLAGASDCGEDAPQRCRTAIASADEQAPTCQPMLDALAACIASSQLSCRPDGIAANGTTSALGPGSPDNFSDVAGFTVVVNDLRCDRYKRGYDACQTCPDAPGAFEPDKLGIADRCETSSECASGLGCIDSQCTRACQSDADCKARAKDCHHVAQYENVCASIGGAQRCTISCATGDDTTCRFYFGDNYSCVDQACVPG